MWCTHTHFHVSFISVENRKKKGKQKREYLCKVASLPLGASSVREYGNTSQIWMVPRKCNTQGRPKITSSSCYELLN